MLESLEMLKVKDDSMKRLHKLMFGCSAPLPSKAKANIRDFTGWDASSGACEDAALAKKSEQLAKLKRPDLDTLRRLLTLKPPKENTAANVSKLIVCFLACPTQEGAQGIRFSKPGQKRKSSGGSKLNSKKPKKAAAGSAVPDSEEEEEEEDNNDREEEEAAIPEGQPSDEEIKARCEAVMSSGEIDVEAASVKTVRKALETHFELGEGALKERKAFIQDCLVTIMAEMAGTAAE